MRHISRFGLALVAGAMVLMPLAVALALPAFDWGIFRQVETASAALHGLSALAALGLMLVAASEPRRLEGAFGGPAMAAAALAAVGLAMLPFADEPLRSLNGTLEHGVGVGDGRQQRGAIGAVDVADVEVGPEGVDGGGREFFGDQHDRL